MSNELKVGAFVLAALLIFLVTFIYVDQLGGVHVPYKTYFNYVGGVDPGSPVRFGGVKVGAITSIRPWRDDPTKIEVVLEVRGGVPVNADSIAMLTSISPLGDKYMEITTGSNQARRLTAGATIKSTEPVSLDDLAKQASTLIPAVRSALDNVQKNIDQLAGNARVVLTGIQAMTGPENQRNLRLMLSSTRSLIDHASPRIDTVLQNLDRASSQAGGVLTQVQSAAKSMNETFNNANRTVDEIRDPMKMDLAEMQQTVADARRLLENLNSIVSSNTSTIEDTLDNFRATSENLRGLTTSLRQRPWTLIRNKPTPDRPVPVVSGGR
jgi:phospholipid/cholesterol/gamma-HCH transport system substrate-binding protein